MNQPIQHLTKSGHNEYSTIVLPNGRIETVLFSPAYPNGKTVGVSMLGDIQYKHIRESGS